MPPAGEMTGWLQRLVSAAGGGGADWEAIEAAFIQADFGARFASEFVGRLRKDAGGFGLPEGGSEAVKRAREAVRAAFDGAVPVPAGSPVHVILMAGVNGAGKTTSAAKLAAWHQRRGKKVRLAAADTFRAAAVEQLETWGTRLGAPVTRADRGSDPAAVAFRAVEEARRAAEDVVIVDTAGRQHTRHNLMAELAKVARVLGKHGAGLPHETLLVVDANTGGNALAQAREFSKTVPITGLVAAKMDGSGLGGAVFAIRKECGIPPRWAGTGERIEDFNPFDVDAYIERLFSGI